MLRILRALCVERPFGAVGVDYAVILSRNDAVGTTEAQRARREKMKIRITES